MALRIFRGVRPHGLGAGLALGLVLAVLAAPARGQTVSEYRFGPEDIIAIQVWGRPDLTGSVTVGFDGRIQIPLLGEVRAGGRTPAELSDDLTQRLQLLDPSVPEVLVSVEEYNSLAVMVVGEVRSAGPYGFREMPDIWEAILTAGGHSDKADMSRVQVVRADPLPGEEPTVTVNLSRGIEYTPRSWLPELRPRDKILIPSAEEIPVQGDRFQVLGAVRAPGVYRLATAQNVVEALSVSGGPTETADMGKVYLTRTTEFGAVAYKMDVRSFLQEAVPLADVGLQPGDTITVPERKSFFISFTEGLSRLTPFVSLLVAALLATR